MFESARISRGKNQAETKIDEEILLMQVETGAFFALRGVGARIWELLESPQTLDTLVKVITAEFEVAEDTCRADALSFLNQLKEKDLIAVDAE